MEITKCKKCNGELKAGKAMAQTFTGKPDFIGDNHICTISAGGAGKLIDCLKCVDCGWSMTRPNDNWDENRVDVIGQNGNEGLHYD